MKRSVFLVEDEDALRALLANHLRKRGHVVQEAANAEAAVHHLLREPPFDLLITDIHLPNLSGLELLRLLQAHSPMKPVLVITGDDDDALANEAIGQGAAGYLLKPFQLSELDAAVAQALRHLELIERLPDDDRPSSAPGYRGIPMAWLEVAEARCGAGPGHGRRVERLVTVLARQSGLEGLEDLGAAARLHEIGQLVGSAGGALQGPAVSAEILADLVPVGIRDLIAGMGAWDGATAGGSPITLRSLLVAADRIDHGAMERVRKGDFPPTAIMAAIDEVSDAAARAVGAELGRALDQAREVLSAIWILSRGGYPSTPPRAHGGSGGGAGEHGP